MQSLCFPQNIQVLKCYFTAMPKKKINNKNYCKDKNLTDYRILYSTVIFSYSVIVPNVFKYQEAVDYHNI